MKGIIYTRVSSDEQVNGTSLEFQEELCRKYGEQKNIEIVEIYREEGESAKDLSLNNREKFLEALEYCRRNKNQIDAFIVLRVDRFARNTEDHFAVRKILLGYGTTLYSVTEPIGNKPAEKFIETVLAGAAEYDNALRKQRCTDGMLARINQGIYPFRPPIGYACANFKKRGEKKTEPDPPDEKTFPIIQRALREYARNVYRQTDIIRMLKEWGLKTSSGKNPTPQMVDRMLRNSLKFYAGIIVNPWTKEEIVGLHKPMITKDEMYQIQMVLSGNSRNNSLIRAKYNPLFPLRRTILCGECNRPLTGSIVHGNGGNYPYYHCAYKLCSMYGKGIGKNLLESEFIKILEKIIPKEKWFNVFRDSIIDVWKERGKQSETDVKRNEACISILKAKKNRIFEMREDGSYTKEEFQKRRDEIEGEIEVCKTELNRHKYEEFNLEEVMAYVIDFIGALAQKWLLMPIAQKTRFQKLVFPDGIPFKRGQGLGTTKLGYVFELIQSFDASKSALVHLNEFSWNQIIGELEEWQKAIDSIELTSQSSNSNSDDIRQLYRNVA
ncbi:MAG: recombinase family protein [Ignavibacteriales bacterium]|nr:recombinase family protein [Ignavibacteriales bacterium]